MFNMELVSRSGPNFDNSRHRRRRRSRRRSRRLRIVRRLMWSQHVHAGCIAAVQAMWLAPRPIDTAPPSTQIPKLRPPGFPPSQRGAGGSHGKPKQATPRAVDLFFVEAPAEASHSLKPSPANPARWQERHAYGGMSRPRCSGLHMSLLRMDTSMSHQHVPPTRSTIQHASRPFPSPCSAGLVAHFPAI